MLCFLFVCIVMRGAARANTCMQIHVSLIMVHTCICL